jgi:hypothetical protein
VPIYFSTESSFFNFSGRLEAASGLPMDSAELGEQLAKSL